MKSIAGGIRDPPPLTCVPAAESKGTHNRQRNGSEARQPL